MKIISVVGARPNFMKIAPFCHALAKYSEIKHILVHTGQHYDVRMNDAFFKELNIPMPDINLNIGSGSHAEQVGRTMIEFEKVVKAEKPDWIVVVGDVNATCACSIVAKKEHVKLAHIEAGLRSGDMDMPEEINRLVTDKLSDLLFTPDDKFSSANLLAEGVNSDKIKFVGNIMIDTLENERSKAEAMDINEIVKRNLLFERTVPQLVNKKYFAMTMHRPSNVDDEKTLRPLINYFCEDVTAFMPVLWAIHPRAQKQLQNMNLWNKVANCENMILLNPLGYHEMLRLNMGAKIFFTDSGGLQEECCVLGTPCITMRWNTERPVTLKENGGASVLVGNSIVKNKKAMHDFLIAETLPRRPEKWDGKTAERIVFTLLSK